MGSLRPWNSATQDHGVPVASQNKGVDVFNRHIEFHADEARKRAESSTPAMPMTRCLGNPLASYATWHMASSGCSQ